MKAQQQQPTARQKAKGRRAAAVAVGGQGARRSQSAPTQGQSGSRGVGVRVKPNSKVAAVSSSGQSSVSPWVQHELDLKGNRWMTSTVGTVGSPAKPLKAHLSMSPGEWLDGAG